MEDHRLKWNRRYAGEDWFLGRRPSPFLAEQIELVTILCRGRKALDVACGEGRNSIFLTRHGFHVTALDISDVGIAKARTWAGEEGLDIAFCRGDIEAYPLTEIYDLIINFNFLLRALVPRLVQALTPGGVIVFDTILDTPALPGEHDKSFLLQPGELPCLFRDFAGTIHSYRECPDEVFPTAKLVFQSAC